MSNYRIDWKSPAPTTLPPKSYTCGYCGSDIASEKGYFGSSSLANAIIYICHKCSRPTLIDDDEKQYPGSSFGSAVQDISDASVAELYNEARACISASAYTAAVLACRKLLMHIAVSKAAEPNKPFTYYVEYLSEKNYVPPDAKPWVDHIRTKGNEANHEIALMKREEAEELISFVEMLLKIIFEFPASVKKRLNTA